MEIYQKHKFVFQMAGFLIVVAAIGLGIAYLTSSSAISTPKADKYSQRSANSHIGSVQSEANANTLEERADEVAKDRETAKKDYQKAKSRIKTPSRKKYEKVRNEPVVINPNDLDARERKLLARLRKLYWQGK